MVKKIPNFSTQTIIHRWRNKVTSLMIDGIWCSDEETLKMEAHTCFKNLFQNRSPCDPCNLILQNIPNIGQNLFESLVQPISIIEVNNAIFSMWVYKALGLDGFRPIFYQTYWDTAGNEVWDLVAQAFATREINPGLEETQVIPIPKVNNPTTLKDFHPISLCNGLLKTYPRFWSRELDLTWMSW